MEAEKIIQRYCSKDKATKEQMWYYYPNLRAHFDYLEKKDALFNKQKEKVTGKKRNPLAEMCTAVFRVSFSA